MTNNDEGDVMTNRWPYSGQTEGCGGAEPPRYKEIRNLKHLNDKPLAVKWPNGGVRGGGPPHPRYKISES